MNRCLVYVQSVIHLGSGKYVLIIMSFITYYQSRYFHNMLDFVKTKLR